MLNRFTSQLAFYFLIFNLYGQQEPISNFFWNNYMHTNPGFTGLLYKHQANAQWRNQWTKVNGAPTTLWVNYAMRLDKIHSGIGVSYEYDVIGLNHQHTALISYAYQIPIKNSVLSIGASGGLFDLKVDADGFVFPQQYESIVNKHKSAFQADFGLAFHTERLNVGLSVTQLNKVQIGSPVYYSLEPQYWLTADYTFLLGQKWKLTPRGQMVSDMNKVSTILNLVATFNNKLWFGPLVRLPGNSMDLGGMVGYDFWEKLRVAYAYEYWYGLNGSIRQNTHEILLSFQLK